MQEAIRRVIPTGFFGNPKILEKYNMRVEKKDKSSVVYWDNGINGIVTSIEVYLLDPEFWKCLGKAEKWGIKCPSSKDGEYFKYKENTNVCWLCRQHQLLDHLAEGKDIESFFKKLL